MLSKQKTKNIIFCGSMSCKRQINQRELGSSQKYSYFILSALTEFEMAQEEGFEQV